MDVELLSLDRLPLPSLKLYTGLSLLAASFSVFYFWTELPVFYLQTMATTSATSSSSLGNIPMMIEGITGGLSGNMTIDPSVPISTNFLLWYGIHWASQQPHCVWPLVNLAYCLLILLSHYIQQSVFGMLRASEQENIKDQFWNLIFYKIVFIFGVVNVQEVEDVVGWSFFVSLIGFLQLARQLSKERHNYLILMNDWTRDGKTRRRRILYLLSFIFITSIFLFLGICGWYMSSAAEAKRTNYNYFNSNRFMTRNDGGISKLKSSPYNFNLGIHNSLFMLSEIGLLVIQTLHALIICIFEQIAFKYNGRRSRRILLDEDEREREPQQQQSNPLTSAVKNEDINTAISHHINFYFDLVALLFDLVHHVHMLICSNLFLSMTSLIVSLQMRARVRQIHGILKKRQSFTWLTEHINKYPDYIPTEEDENENCAICWDTITSQKPKLLPCKHIFHKSCLRKWLLVSMNCPTCRLSLVTEKELNNKNNNHMRRPPRRQYDPRPDGFWGFLETGQTLLDLFGGWDPQADEIYSEAPPQPRGVNLFGGDFGVQTWAVESEPPPNPTSESDTHKRD